MTPGADAGVAPRGDAGHGAQAEVVRLGQAGDEERGGAVVERRAVAGGDAAAGLEDGLELGELLEGAVATDALVGGEAQRVLTFGLGDVDRDDLVVEPAIVLGGGGLLVAGEGPGVLIGAADVVAAGDVLGGDAERVDAVQALHRGVDHAPAEGGVEELGVAGEGLAGLGHDEGGAGHALDAASDVDLALADHDRLGGLEDGLHARAAQAVDGDAGDLNGDAGEEEGHAGDVAVVLAGLVGAAEIHVGELLDGGPVVFGERADHVRGEVVRAHRGQRPAEPADRRADSGDDDRRASIRGHVPTGVPRPGPEPGWRQACAISRNWALAGLGGGFRGRGGSHGWALTAYAGPARAVP
jgi:hypothetical protein